MYKNIFYEQKFKAIFQVKVFFRYFWMIGSWFFGIIRRLMEWLIPVFVKNFCYLVLPALVWVIYKFIDDAARYTLEMEAIPMLGIISILPLFMFLVFGEWKKLVMLIDFNLFVIALVCVL